MKQFFCMILLLSAIFYLGCSAKTVPIAPPQQSSPVVSAESIPAKLPSLLTLDINKARQVAGVYREFDTQKIIAGFNPSMIRNIFAKTQYTGVFLSRCDIDVLRTLVASGWAPSVIIQAPTGLKHIRIIIGYNDPPERLTLVDFIDPKRLMQLDEGYAEFTKQWDNQTCVVFDRNVSESGVKFALEKYLSSDKVASIGITDRVK
jgi:hypothetical protein